MKTNKIKPDRLTTTKKGLVISYIGDGKGKTTAAMGVAVRAAGAGMDVYILQFVKARAPKDGEHREGGEWPLSSEIDFFNQTSYHKPVGQITTEQVGLGFVGILGDQKDRAIHIREALNGLARARDIIQSGQYKVVILDEIISALELKLIEERDILELIANKPEMLHLVITGHNKFPKIIKACDLVTEMKMIKHPYYQGILAQRGIDF
jgi:cob(I)alamin adenosyltransferase